MPSPVCARGTSTSSAASPAGAAEASLPKCLPLPHAPARQPCTRHRQNALARARCDEKAWGASGARGTKTYIAEVGSCRRRQRRGGRGAVLEEPPEQRRGGCRPRQRGRTRSARGRRGDDCGAQQAAAAGSDAGAGHWGRLVSSSRWPATSLLEYYL
jgi:hypothetical protein